MYAKWTFLGALVVATLAAGTANSAPLINGDFETADFTGWTLFTTANGVIGGLPPTATLPTPGVYSTIVIPLPLPFGASWAATLQAGETLPITGTRGGGGIAQSVDLPAGSYTISADIATGILFAFNTLDGGFFELIVDGSVEASHDFGTVSSDPFLGTEFSALLAEVDLAAGSHDIEIRVTRSGGIAQGLTPTHFVDNVDLVLGAAIDIKPRGPLNAINVANQGVIPVAILGSESFDVTEVDSATLAFGPGGAAPAHAGGHLEDVQPDGFTDLVLHFGTQESGIASGDTEACVTGELLDATPFEGCDSVVAFVPCGIGFELALVLPPLAWLRRRRRANRAGRLV